MWRLRLTRKLKLSLPLKTFDKLFAAADGRGKKALVSKADLRALLIDHSRAIAALGDEVEDGYQTDSHVRKAAKG